MSMTPGFAEVHPAGDARRLAERKIADIVHRQSVHLRDDGAGNIDHEGALGEQLLNALIDQVRPVDLFIQGLVHMRRRHDPAPGLFRPVGRLAHQVRKFAEAERELVLFFGKSHGVVHDSGDGAPVKGEQAVILSPWRR